MADGTGSTLPDGEFFMLDDDRLDEEVLRCGYTPDIDPEWSGFRGYLPVPVQYDPDPDRSRALGMARFELIRQLYPERPITEVLPHLFEDSRVRLDENMLIGAAYFKGRMPKKIAHFDRLIDYACEPTVRRDGTFHDGRWSYNLVSKEWKDAVVSLEAGVHQFFPCDLVFADGTLRGHFVFRDMQIIDFVDLARSVPGEGVRKMDRGEFAGQYFIVSMPRGLVGRRDALLGRHWVKQKGKYYPFLSRMLSERLISLLPKGVELIPVRLV